MTSLFTKKTENCSTEATLIAEKIAGSIVFLQRKFAECLQKVSNNIPHKIQGYAFVSLTVLCLFYCGLLIFGNTPHIFTIATTKPFKEAKASSVDSLQKLEIIYQSYLKH